MRGLLIFLTIVGYVFASGYDYLNQLRLQAGMIPLSKNQILEQAAKNHNRYMIANNVFSHYESQDGAYFTGITPSDRAVKAGYASRYVLENISAGEEEIESAIDGLFSAIYHRFGFLNFTIDEVGAAFDINQSYGYKSVATFNMGNRGIRQLCEEEEYSGYAVYNICADRNKRVSANSYQNAINNVAEQNPSIVLWPYKDATDIPPVFYEEFPDPLPECSVSGYPVSVNFNPYKTTEEPTLVDFYLEDSRGNLVPLIKTMTYESDEHGKFSQYDFAIFPKDRLQWAQEYQATLIYTLHAQTYTLRWKFRTRALPGVYYEARGNGESYRVISGKRYYFYFPPRDCNDKLSSLRYNYKSGMRIENGFYDLNTIWMEVIGAVGDEVNVRFDDGRAIKLVVATSDSAQSATSSSSISISPTSSSFSSISSAACPDGYKYIDGIFMLISQSSSSLSQNSSLTVSSSSSSSSISEDIAKKLAGRVLDISGYFAYYGDLKNYDPFAWVYLSRGGGIFVKLEGMDEQTGRLKWKFLKKFFSSVKYSHGFIEIGEAAFGLDSATMQILERLQNRKLRVAGYFAYYGDLKNYDPFAWIYVSKSGNLLVKLQGMDPKTGKLRWEYLIGKGKKRIKSVEIVGDKIYIGNLVEDGALPPL